MKKYLKITGYGITRPEAFRVIVQVPPDVLCFEKRFSMTFYFPIEMDEVDNHPDTAAALLQELGFATILHIVMDPLHDFCIQQVLKVLVGRLLKKILNLFRRLTGKGFLVFYKFKFN